MKQRTLHGDSKSRLYRCWSHMIERTKGRKDCIICDEWEEYIGFRKWAMANGYDKTKCLCRNGDIGNYEPSNARWDTHAKNMEEAHARHFKVMLEDKIIEIYNLTKFCKERNLNYIPMLLVATQKQGSHKGYTKYVEEEQKCLP